MDNETSTFRIIQMNENVRKRRMHYIYILLVWIAATLLILLVYFFCQLLPLWFPCKLFMLLIVFAALGVSFYLYMDLVKRDPMDYDRLDLSPPDLVPYVDTSANDFAAFVLGQCKGEECCSYGTRWNHTIGRCVVVTDLSGMAADMAMDISNVLQYFKTNF